MTQNKTTIHGNIGHRERAQSKFLEISDTNLIPDYELLELILMRSIPRIDVKPIAKELLNRFGSLSAVLTANPEDLFTFSHIKKSTLVLFRLIIEANKRILREDMSNRPVLSAWENMIDYCFMQLQHESIEKFLILYLDIKAQLIRSEILQTGTIDRVPIYPREVLKRALVLGAESVIIAHNHPSGNVQPSVPDMKMTVELYKTLTAADIRLIDHLIVGPGRQLYSFSAHGHLTAFPTKS